MGIIWFQKYFHHKNRRIYSAIQLQQKKIAPESNPYDAKNKPGLILWPH